MNPIKVSAEHTYQVFIEPLSPRVLEPLLNGANQVAIIVPNDLRNLALPVQSMIVGNPALKNVLIIEVGAGENQKEIDTLARCWGILGKAHFQRSDVIIGIGGGATTDLAGFVAATWLRGVKWAAIPTSLAGMVDAAVGGKTGINTAAGKNLVGAFYSPQVVVVDVRYLETLPITELRAGMAEIIKTGFIGDQKILEIIESHDNFLDPRSSTLHELIQRSITVKADVVSKDLKESFLRESLNYGHTLAHAIERHERYSWRHGDAVAVGLAYIAHLSHLSGIASAELRDRHLRILGRAQLPTTYLAQAWPQLLAAMQSDKKARAGNLRFVAVNDNYEVVRLEGVADELLQSAYERISL
jgi:3-dehydroquinate synthase